MNLVQQYQDMGSDISRIIFRIPATWEGIQAAKDLEARGIATHIILINRCRGLQLKSTCPEPMSNAHIND